MSIENKINSDLELVDSDRNKILTAQSEAATKKPESENKANWEDVVKYYEGNTDPNWKFKEKDKKEVDGIMYEFVIVNLTDTNDADAFMNIFDDGDVSIWNKGQGTGRSYGKCKESLLF